MAPAVAHADRLVIVIDFRLIVGKERLNRLIVNAEVALEQTGANSESGLRILVIPILHGAKQTQGSGHCTAIGGSDSLSYLGACGWGVDRRAERKWWLHVVLWRLDRQLLAIGVESQIKFRDPKG